MKKRSYLFAFLMPSAAFVGGMAASPGSDMFSLFIGGSLIVGLIYMSYKVAEWRKANPKIEEKEELISEIQE